VLCYFIRTRGFYPLPDVKIPPRYPPRNDKMGEAQNCPLDMVRKDKSRQAGEPTRGPDSIRYSGHRVW